MPLPAQQMLCASTWNLGLILIVLFLRPAMVRFSLLGCVHGICSVPGWWKRWGFPPEPSPKQVWGLHGKKPESCISRAGRLHVWKCFHSCYLFVSKTGHYISSLSEVVFLGLLGLHTGYLRAVLSLSPEWRSEEMGMLPTHRDVGTAQFQ